MPKQPPKESKPPISKEKTPITRVEVPVCERCKKPYVHCSCSANELKK